MISYTIPGYFSINESKAIKEALEGETFYNLHVEYSNNPVNSTVTVYARNENYNDENCDENMFRDDLMWIIAVKLADKCRK